MSVTAAEAAKVTSLEVRLPEATSGMADWKGQPLRLAVLRFRKRLAACIKAKGGHFEHSLNLINT